MMFNKDRGYSANLANCFFYSEREQVPAYTGGY